MLHVGCIADDFTGASDIASFFKKGGMKTVLFNGIPENESLGNYDAVVIALKTRTQDTRRAVSDSLRAVRWLEDQGAQHLYIKYCSTFDSTPKGNIGPIIDAVMDMLGLDYTILCPALPVNGRIVREGRLYVNGVPLDESPMKNHPLTPMWDSYIEELMRPQGKYPCLTLTTADMKRPGEELREIIEAFKKENPRFYIVPDFIEDGDAQMIAEVFGDKKLLTGGSGIAEALAGKYVVSPGEEDKKTDRTEGKTLLLAGSCSSATLAQIRKFISDGGAAVKMLPDEMLAGRQTVEGIWKQVEAMKQPVLVYSSDSAEEVKKVQEKGAEVVSGLLEEATARLAKLAEDAGYTHIIVAGGETSGAVTRRLGYRSFEIGMSIAPGVPIMIPTGNRKMRIVLKSGNFGDEEFFANAVRMVST